MIKANGGEVTIKGVRIELQAEFMSIVQAFVKKGVFADDESLLEAVHIAMIDEDELKQMVVTATQEAIASKIAHDLMEKLRNEKDV